MIRRMTMEDIPKVAKLERDTFQDPWSENVYRKTLELDETCYLVAEENGDIIGVAGVRNILGDGEITNVMVRKDLRGNGLGRKIMLQLLEEGKKLGVIDFTLEVRKSNAPALALYEGLGFISEGIRPGFYDHPKEDAVIMWKRENS